MNITLKVFGVKLGLCMVPKLQNWVKVPQWVCQFEIIDYSSFNLSHLQSIYKDIRCSCASERFPSLRVIPHLIQCKKQKNVQIKCNFTFDSLWHQQPEIICSGGNVRRRSPVSVLCCICVLWWSSNQIEIHMCAPCQQQGRNMAPDYRQVLWNVIPSAAWYSGLRGEALPFAAVWLTHAIPHICSISDCITEGVQTISGIRFARLVGWNKCNGQLISVTGYLCTYLHLQ